MSTTRSGKKNPLQIVFILDALFPHPKPELIAPNPYCFLIAVLLSARCTDRVVNRVTRDLFFCADTPEAMLTLSQEMVYKIVSPCGLGHRKAPAILEISRRLIREYNGELMPSREILESFPSVGRKTASVVLSQCFGIPAFAVDTHVFRCSKRWGLSLGMSPLAVEKDLIKLFPENLWSRLHLQMIAAGRTYCLSRPHDCATCRICSVLA